MFQSFITTSEYTFRGKQIDDVLLASRRLIPRGCRTEYVPDLSNQSKSLYEAYKDKYLSNPFNAAP